MKLDSFVFILVFFLTTSCSQDDYIPKPYGYMRIEFPNHEYVLLESDCPFSFEMPTYASVESKNDSSDFCHKNISYVGFNATLHLSYFKINDDINKYLEYSRSLAYQHQVKADAIIDSVFIFPEQKVYGTAHYIEGNAASPFQFYLTDSTEHFLRGSLYFNATPNYDSLRSSINHLLYDMKHQIESTYWK